MDIESISYKHDDKYLRDKLNWPQALIKATQDKYEYALKLRGSESVLKFNEAKYINDQFVKLLTDDFPRGIEVRVGDIIWVIDAPNGVI